MAKERIRNLVRDLIIEIGEDPTREGLRGTPDRVADMYDEIFDGYEADAELNVQFSENSDVVVIRDIKFYSMCEHHMLPFFGKVSIAYAPKGRVFGTSKLVRLVKKHARRLQIQERLTRGIADDLNAQDVKGVAVWVNAEHLCMRMRGVENEAEMVTSAFRGIYENYLERQSVAVLVNRRGAGQSD